MKRLVILLTVLVAFTAWSSWITWEEGYWGFLTLALEERWGAQVLVDLVIMSFVAWGGIWKDARQQRITAWPYLVATLFLGSIGPLAYLVHRQLKKLRPVSVPAARGA